MDVLKEEKEGNIKAWKEKRWCL